MRSPQALGHRAGDAPAPRQLLAAAAADPGIGGSWSGVLPAPVVPIFAALLPNGKVLIWDSVGDNAAETYDDQSFTRAAVYDPATGTSKSVNVAGANIFCAGFVQLANGNVFVAGGNADRALNGIRQTHTFDWRTETWSRGPDMQDGRWYPSVAAMPNEEAVIVGGGPTQAEVRTSSGGLRRLTGFTTPSSREYPFLQAAPDGRALLLGPSASMSLLDWGGAGAIAAFATRDAIHRGYGSYAAYDVGRFLVAGGGSVSEDGASGPSRTATVVDTRGIGAAARPTGSMTYRRRQSNLTLLADGSALVTGGQSTGGGGGLVDLANAVYAAERWDPATETWSTLNSAAVARQYHSTALLLPDGRVLTGGGGICGECDRVGYLRKDFEIFTPPYLFRRDGSGQLAARPEISAAPSVIGYDSAFTVSSPQAAQLSRLGLVRLGAPTHGQDQGQRYVPLSFTASGATLAVTAPNNPNEAPPGHYMLFAVNTAGVPSVAAIVEVKRQAVSGTPGAVNLALGRPATGSTPCAASEGPEKAFNGSVSGGWSDKWCSKVAGSRRLRVDLGSSRSVSTFVVKHASAGGESSSMNTRAYRIETSTNGSSWSTAVTVGANTAGVTTSTVDAAHGPLRPARGHGFRAGSRGGSGPDLRARGLLGHGGARAGGARGRLRGPQPDRPGAAVRGRAVRARSRQPRPAGQRCRALDRGRAGIPGDDLPRSRHGRRLHDARRRSPRHAAVGLRPDAERAARASRALAAVGGGERRVQRLGDGGDGGHVNLGQAAQQRGRAPAVELERPALLAAADHGAVRAVLGCGVEHARAADRLLQRCERRGRKRRLLAPRVVAGAELPVALLQSRRDRAAGPDAAVVGDAAGVLVLALPQAPLEHEPAGRLAVRQRRCPSGAACRACPRARPAGSRPSRRARGPGAPRRTPSRPSR